MSRSPATRWDARRHRLVRGTSALTVLLLGATLAACDPFGAYFRGRDRNNYEDRLPPRRTPELRARVARRDTLEMQRYVRLSRARARFPDAYQAYDDSISCEYRRLIALYPMRVTMRPNFLLSLLYPATPEDAAMEHAASAHRAEVAPVFNATRMTDAHCAAMLRTAWGDSMPVAPDTTLDPPVPVAPGRP